MSGSRPGSSSRHNHSHSGRATTGPGPGPGPGPGEAMPEEADDLLSDTAPAAAISATAATTTTTTAAAASQDTTQQTGMCGRGGRDAVVTSECAAGWAVTGSEDGAQPTEPAGLVDLQDVEMTDDIDDEEDDDDLELELLTDEDSEDGDDVEDLEQRLITRIEGAAEPPSITMDIAGTGCEASPTSSSRGLMRASTEANAAWDAASAAVASHTYLPASERATRALDVELLAPGTELVLLSLLLPARVLFPGDTLPLRIRAAQLVASVETVLADMRDGRPALVVVACVVQTGTTWDMAAIGTIACVESYGRGGQAAGGAAAADADRGFDELAPGEVALLLRGLQRCVVTPTGTSRVAVKALGEDNTMATGLIRKTWAWGPGAKSPKAQHVCVTHTPSFVLAANDPILLAARVRRLVCQVLYSSGTEADALASRKLCSKLSAMSPSEVAYWVARSVPMGHAQAQAILADATVASRLKTLLGMLQSAGEIQCRQCSTVLSSMEHAAVLSSLGVGGSFVNPAGAVHQIITLRRVSNMISIDAARAEHSWFPGYAWSVLLCGTCCTFQGWQFDLVTSPRMSGATPAVLSAARTARAMGWPTRFWGLTRDTIVIAGQR